MSSETCLIEVYRNGAVGDDFGWPGEAPRFAIIDALPASGPRWPEFLRMWIHTSGCAGDGVPGEWSRVYITADGLRSFLDMAFGPGGSEMAATKAAISDKDRYILFAGENRRPVNEDRTTWSIRALPKGRGRERRQGGVGSRRLA